MIRGAYDAWAAGDFEAIFEISAPDIEWIPPAYALEHGPFRGVAEVRKAIGAYFESFEEFRPEPEEILRGAGQGEYLVLATTYTRGKGSGVELTMSVAHMITIREGKVVRFEVIPDRPEAMRRAGLVDDG